MSGLRFGAGIVLTLVLFSQALLAHAEPEQRDFSIPAQELDAALLEFSRQARVQVFFPSQVGESELSTPLHGHYTITGALNLLLEGTDLEYRFTDPQTISLARRPPTALAAVNTQTIEELLVTGSHIWRTSGFDTPSPITVIERATLLAEGNIELPRLLQNLPFNSGAEVQVHSLEQPLTAGTGAVNLRNLGLGATMVLLNGHRQTNTAVATTEGETFVDVNSLLPVIAIERLEILRGGASSTYGSDAVAGVVNLVPRLNFSGLEIEGRFQDTGENDQADRRLSLLWGTDLAENRGHIMSALSYLDRERLATTRRSFTEGSVTSSLGKSGTYLGSEGFIQDPGCADAGGPKRPDSEFCLFDSSPWFDLSPEEERWQWFGALDYQLTQNSHIKANLSWNDATVKVSASPSFPFATALPEVPIDNPGNVFGEPVLFYGRVLGAEAGASSSTSNYRHYFGSLKLVTDYQVFPLISSLSYSRNQVDYGRADTVKDRLQAALDGRGGDQQAQYWNPLFGADNDTSLVQSLFADWGMRGETELYTADVIANTDWRNSGSYRYAFAVGGHFRRETLSHDFAQVFNDHQLLAPGGGPDFDAERDVSSLFGELNITAADRLELQLAARYENYDQDFDSLSPKIGLRWQASESTSFSASWSRPYRAPSLFQVSASQSVPRAVSDHLIPGTPIFTNVITIGSRELGPEEADVFTVGLGYQGAKALRTQLDFWYYDYRDLILKESPQAVLERAAMEPLESTGEARSKIVRDASSGQILQINADFINAASIETAGIDWSTDYEWLLPAGRVSIGTAWTWTERFDIQEMPGGPVIDGVGRRNVTTPAARSLPEWKGNAWLGWNRGPHQGRLRLNYVDGYRDDGNADEPIDSHTTVDIHYRLQTPLGDDQVQIGVGLINALDEDPPAVDTFLGYDAKTHDPRGRLWYLQLTYVL